jgi:hypothetical protein
MCRRRKGGEDSFGREAAAGLKDPWTGALSRLRYYFVRRIMLLGLCLEVSLHDLGALGPLGFHSKGNGVLGAEKCVPGGGK